MKKSPVILIIVLFFANVTAASEKHFYVGGSIGTTIFKGEKTILKGADYSNGGDDNYIIDSNMHEINGQDISGKIFGGYQFHEYLAVEKAAYYFGQAKDEYYEDDKYYSWGMSASLLGIIPLTDNLDFLMKIGILYSNFDRDGESLYMKEEGKSWVACNHEGYSVLVGGGINFKITEKIQIRAEIEWSPDIVNSDPESLESKLVFINKKLIDENKDTEFGYDANVDILLISTGLVWSF